MLRLIAFPALVLVAGPATILSAAAPRGESGLHLVLVPPWHDSGALIAAAGGQPVGPVRAAFGHLVSAAHPDFRARAAGLGLLVLDGQRLGFICRRDS